MIEQIDLAGSFTLPGTSITLNRMGYGASRADLQRVGGSGEGGIDGVISLDKLTFHSSNFTSSNSTFSSMEWASAKSGWSLMARLK